MTTMLLNQPIESFSLQPISNLNILFFVPALLKRTVVDPGLLSAKQAVTGDIRGAASTALGAAATATKEGAGDYYSR